MAEQKSVRKKTSLLVAAVVSIVLVITPDFSLAREKTDSIEQGAFDGRGLYGEKFATRPLFFRANMPGGKVSIEVWGLKFGSSGPPDLSRKPMIIECEIPCKIEVPVHTKFSIQILPPDGHSIKSGLEKAPAWKDGLLLVKLEPNEIELEFD